MREIVAAKVRPERELLGDNPNNIPLKRRWWAFQAHRPELLVRLAKIKRALCISRVTHAFAFAFVPANWVFSEQVVVFPLDSDSFFGVMQSRVHELWARFFSGSLEDRLRYTASDCFETFPFPAGWEEDPALEVAGREYYEARAALMVRTNKGLTKIYNDFHDPECQDAPDIQRLHRLHAAIDRAVLAAYGWGDLVENGRTTCEYIPDYHDEPEQEGSDPIPKSIRYRWPDATRDEVLARLLKLNAERHAQEVREGLYSPLATRKATAKKAAGKATKKPLEKPASPEPETGPRLGQTSLQFGTDDLDLFTTGQEGITIPSTLVSGLRPSLDSGTYFKIVIPLMIGLLPEGVGVTRMLNALEILSETDERRSSIKKRSEPILSDWSKTIPRTYDFTTAAAVLLALVNDGTLIRFAGKFTLGDGIELNPVKHLEQDALIALVLARGLPLAAPIPLEIEIRTVAKYPALKALFPAA